MYHKPQSHSTGALPGAKKSGMRRGVGDALHKSGSWVVSPGLSALSTRSTWRAPLSPADAPTEAMVKAWPRWAAPGFLEQMPPRLEGCRQRLLAAEIELRRAEKAGGLSVGTAAMEASETPAVVQDLHPLRAPQETTDEFADLPQEGDLLLEQAAEVLAQLSALDAKIEDLHATNASARQMRDDHADQLRRCVEVLPRLSNRAGILAERLREAQGVSRALKGKLSTAVRGIGKLKQQLAEGQNVATQLREQLQVARRVAEQFKEKRDEVEARLSSLQLHVSSLENAKLVLQNDLAACQARLSEEQSGSAHLLRRVEELSSENTAKEAEVQQLRKTFQDGEGGSLRLLEEMRVVLQGKDTELEQLRAALASKEEEKSKLQEDLQQRLGHAEMELAKERAAVATRAAAHDPPSAVEPQGSDTPAVQEPASRSAASAVARLVVRDWLRTAQEACLPAAAPAPPSETPDKEHAIARLESRLEELFAEKRDSEAAGQRTITDLKTRVEELSAENRDKEAALQRLRKELEASSTGPPPAEHVAETTKRAEDPSVQRSEASAVARLAIRGWLRTAQMAFVSDPVLPERAETVSKEVQAGPAEQEPPATEPQKTSEEDLRQLQEQWLLEWPCRPRDLQSALVPAAVLASGIDHSLAQGQLAPARIWLDADKLELCTQPLLPSGCLERFPLNSVKSISCSQQSAFDVDACLDVTVRVGEETRTLKFFSDGDGLEMIMAGLARETRVMPGQVLEP